MLGAWMVCFVLLHCLLRCSSNAALPPGWIACVDPRGTFYHNPATGVSQWEIPKELAQGPQFQDVHPRSYNRRVRKLLSKYSGTQPSNSIALHQVNESRTDTVDANFEEPNSNSRDIPEITTGTIAKPKPYDPYNISSSAIEGDSSINEVLLSSTSQTNESAHSQDGKISKPRTSWLTWLSKLKNGRSGESERTSEKRGIYLRKGNSTQGPQKTQAGNLKFRWQTRKPGKRGIRPNKVKRTSGQITVKSNDSAVELLALRTARLLQAQEISEVIGLLNDYENLLNRTECERKALAEELAVRATIEKELRSTIENNELHNGGSQQTAEKKEVKEEAQRLSDREELKRLVGALDLLSTLFYPDAIEEAVDGRRVASQGPATEWTGSVHLADAFAIGALLTRAAGPHTCNNTRSFESEPCTQAAVPQVEAENDNLEDAQRNHTEFSGNIPTHRNASEVHIEQLHSELARVSDENAILRAELSTAATLLCELRGQPLNPYPNIGVTGVVKGSGRTPASLVRAVKNGAVHMLRYAMRLMWLD